MAKRSRELPSALHSELTEYSSLMRTLRTNNILDVSLHLTQCGRDGSSLVPDEERISLQEQITDAVYNKNGTKREQHGQKRDNWTRWPLLLKDLSKPTWSFEDEVAIIASQALKLHMPLSSFPQGLGFNNDPQSCPAERTEHVSRQNSDDAEDDDLGVDDPDVPSYYKYIAMSTYDFLLNMLALIAAHLPPRPPSMQNRIEPLNWRSILEIVSAYGDYEVINEQILSQIQTRMEALYGLPERSSFPEFGNGESSVVFRLRKKNETEQQLNNIMSQAFESVFELPPSSFIKPPKAKKQRKAMTKKETDKIELPNTISSKDKQQVSAGIDKGKGVRKKDKDKDQPKRSKTRKNFKSRAFISDSSDGRDTDHI